MAEKRGFQLSKEEFVTWLQPRSAVALLTQRNGWPKSDAVRAIITRLSAHLIRAAAEYAVLTNRAGEDRKERFQIPPKHWNPDSQWVPDAALWETGDIYFDLSEGSGYSVQVAGRVSYFGVRFERAGIEAMCHTPDEPAEAEPVNSNRKPLSDALLSDWASLFNKAYPGGSESLAARSVAGMFPDKHVSRARLRRVLPERKRGRPHKSNDLENAPKNDGE